ncbi:MAG: aminoglycoside phosphotransferase family protein [Ruminococcus sp.]|nr:aminoglycoside phosphotransferase family protein [Ruminococcus sp.]
METAMFDIEFLQSNFKLQGTYQSYKPLNDGHINSTFVLDYADEDGTAHSYVVQKINTHIFTNPDALMGNIVGVTTFLQKKIAARGGNVQRETLDFLPAADGKYYAKDSAGSCWRCYRHIGNVYTCNIIDSEEVFYNAGTAFGAFQQALADYPSETLVETIPNFHNTYSRFLDFKKAVADDLSGRRANVQDEIQFILDREADTHVLLDLIDKGELPLRVTHNDTKLNNILFDNKTNQGICIIDLDTVMPGLALYDFGDSIRFGANTASEDEKDVSKVSLSLPLYKAYTEGYLHTAKDSLWAKEIEYLPFSAKLMTLECGMRFLADYLNGDTYFKTAYPEHNLVRCRTQLALVADMERKMEEMQKITADAAK